jgi:hypothetical protein
MMGKGKRRVGISVVVLSLIITISLSNSLSNGFSSVYASSFADVGDWGCSSNAKNTVANIVEKNEPTILSLGDNSYEDTATCWFNIVEPIDGDPPAQTIKMTFGNHDDDNSNKLNAYKNHFNFGNKLYYSFERGGGSIHILVMNSEDSDRSDKNSAQYKFVKSDLENAHNNPAIKWIIVFVHQPFFTSPNGCSANSCKGSKSFTETYQPLFDQNKVDIALFGHVHNYQRTFPLKFNSGDPLNPTKTSTAKCDYTNPTGTVYAIVGTGGINFHSLGSKASFVSVQQANRFGQLDLTTQTGSDFNKLTGKFYANEGGNLSGCQSSPHTLDRFTITKTVGATSITSVSSGIDPFA